MAVSHRAGCLREGVEFSTPHETLRQDEGTSGQAAIPGALASGRQLCGAALNSAPFLCRGGPSSEQANDGVLQEDKEVNDELK